MSKKRSIQAVRPVATVQPRGSFDGNNIAMFLVLPALSLYNAIRHIRASYAMNAIWLFSGYFGLTFVLASGSSADSARIVQGLLDMHESRLSFEVLTSFFYSEKTGQLDIVQPLITFIISRFTDNPKILYMVFGLLFGYFYSRNIGYIIHKTMPKKSWYSAFLLISFALVVPVWFINGFRYYMAAQVFIFGVLPYLMEGSRKRLYYALFAGLIHWSFFIAIGLLFAYMVIKNRTLFYYVLFVTTFFISLLNIEIIRTLFESYAPAVVQETRAGYLGEAYGEVISEKNTSVNWYVNGHFEALKWLIFALASYLYLAKKSLLKSEKGNYNIFNFSLFFFGFINLFSVVPSVNRFYVIPVMLFLAVFYMISKDRRFTLPPMARQVAIFILLLFILVRIRIGFDFVGALLLFGNPLVALFVDNQTPLIEFVKMFF